MKKIGRVNSSPERKAEMMTLHYSPFAILSSPFTIHHSQVSSYV